MKQKTPIDPFKRGFEDFNKEIFECPYAPKSKAAIKWKNGQDSAEMQQAMQDGAYDDGGLFQ